MRPDCIDITIAGDTGLIKRLNRIIPLGERPFYDEPYGWMGGWAGGQMLIWAVLAILVVVVVVIKSLIRKK